MTTRAIKFRPLGSTGIRVSEVSFGAGPVSGVMSASGDRPQQLATVRRALEAGINWFDTAATYGGGQSEINVGAALKELGALPGVHVATKVRLEPEQLGNIKSCVKASVQGSLRRLGLPRVTLIQLHNSITRNRGDLPTSITPRDVIGPGGALAAFMELKAEGLVDYFGLTGLGDTASLLEVVRSAPWATIQINENVLHPRAFRHPPRDDPATDREDLIAACVRLRIGVIAIRVLAGGALARQPPSAHTLTTKFFPLELYQRDEERAAQLARLLPSSMTVKELAIRYVLSEPDVATALIGFASPEQVEEAVRFANVGPLPANLLQALLIPMCDQAEANG